MHLPSRLVPLLLLVFLTATTQGLPTQHHVPSTGNIESGSHAPAPSSLLGRHYTLVTKREDERFKFRQSVPVHGSSENISPESNQNDSTTMTTPAHRQTRRDMSFPQYLKIARALELESKEDETPRPPEPRLARMISKRDPGDVNYVSDVGPGPIQPPVTPPLPLPTPDVPPAPVTPPPPPPDAPAPGTPSVPPPPPPPPAPSPATPSPGDAPFKSFTGPGDSIKPHSKKGKHAKKGKKGSAKFSKNEKGKNGK